MKIYNDNYEKWDELLALFDDSNIYQTPAFGKFSKGGNKLEYNIIEKNGEVVAIAQVRIKTIPLLNKGIAYVRWGPLWQLQNQSPNPENLQLAIKKLTEEYVTKRKLVLRIMPNITDKSEIFSSLGFEKLPDHKPYRTFVVDIRDDFEEIRKRFRKKWRYSLRQAEKNGILVKSGDSIEMFDTFLILYRSMHNRKKFKEFVDVESFRNMQQLLPTQNKMKIFIAYFENNPVASIVVSAMGNTGIYLLGGSNETGLKYSASYLLQWKAIEWMKEKNIQYYDLGGIDPETNPGVYTFKKGLGGEDISFIGTYELSNGFLSKAIVNVAEKLRK